MHVPDTEFVKSHILWRGMHCAKLQIMQMLQKVARK
jgi:hypothetical protein